MQARTRKSRSIRSHPTTQSKNPNTPPKQYNTLKCTPCRIRKEACNYETTNPNGSCELCSIKPHELDCGPKLRSKKDNRWAEWNNTEEFFEEIRRLVELRLQRGESQDDIRGLLQVPTVAMDDSPQPQPQPSLFTNNPTSPSTISPLQEYLFPLEESSSTIFSTSNTTSQIQWNHNSLPMNYPTVPITSSSADMFGNGSSPFQLQFPAGLGISSEDYPPSSDNSQTTSSFSNSISQQDNIFPSYDFSAWPSDSTFPDQAQLWPTESFDSYGFPTLMAPASTSQQQDYRHQMHQAD